MLAPAIWGKTPLQRPYFLRWSAQNEFISRETGREHQGNHMKLLPLALIACLATPAFGFDISTMSETEREAFRAEVRSYLLENPEVLAEAFEVLQNRQAEAEAEGDLVLVTANADDLFQEIVEPGDLLEGGQGGPVGGMFPGERADFVEDATPGRVQVEVGCGHDFDPTMLR